MTLTYTRPKVQDLSADEKDRLLEAILDHLGREIELSKWDGDSSGHINLVKPERY